jgi:hypothetical protein
MTQGIPKVYPRYTVSIPTLSGLEFKIQNVDRGFPFQKEEGPAEFLEIAILY